MIDIKCKAENFKLIPVEQIVPNPRNNNRHSIEQINAIAKLIKAHGFREPLTISNRSGFLNCGHARLEAAKTLGMSELPVIYQDFASEAEEYQHMTADNEIARWAELDFQGVYDALKEIPEIDTSLLGIEDFKLPGDDELKLVTTGELAKKFIAPPLSVIDLRQGYLSERQKLWNQIGIKSDEGRSDNILGNSDKLSGGKKENGFETIAVNKSIFNPVLAEIAYRWFSHDDCIILDPFAGGSVRGVVASHCNRRYIGIDLRDQQVSANRNQKNICNESYMPTWICGDSLDMPLHISNAKADFIFSCPPYADLEVYSDDIRDLSNMDYNNFISTYSKIIKNCYDALNDNRFACFIIGEVRSKNGSYYNFLGDTINAFLQAGFSYYNEMTVITAFGSAAMTAPRAFKASRKIGKCHQNMLVFVKGDYKKATEFCGDINIDMSVISDGVTTSE